MSLLSVESIACVPYNTPWAARVLAGAIAFELEGEPKDPFPDAYEGVRALAQACSVAKYSSYFVHPNLEAAFVLGAEKPYGDAHVFVLVEDRHSMGYLVDALDREPAVHWFDDSDGSSRGEGKLERWCDNLLRDWVWFTSEDFDPDAAMFRPLPTDADRFVRYLKALTTVRDSARQAATAEATRLEHEAMQLEGDAAEAAFKAWNAAAERVKQLEGRPWPKV